tara:strand:- start:4317 stop:7577 length:3261 start_codon:yes stop_codon:yes gene_type:complete
MLRKKYQNAGYWDDFQGIPLKSTTYRDLKPELADAIQKVSDEYGGKDLLTYTAIAESTGGWNPSAGTNYMQIMPPAYNAIKDVKSHPKNKKKLEQVKDKFGIDFNNMTLEQVRSNPLANVLAARLYYMLDPTAAPTSVEGIGQYWSDYYNTSSDVHGTPDYYNQAVSEFNYKENPNRSVMIGPSFEDSYTFQIPESEDKTEKTKKTKKGPYSSVGKRGWFNLPDMGITEYLFGFQNGGLRQKQASGGMYMSNPSLYQKMQQLPGGMMTTIPGSDAVEFTGQTHDQGGILVDPMTEVEDGETMDKVVMKNGGAKDYFFSSHLKKGGMSFADMHKQILASGGDQEQINYLARMQEKAAGRSPNKVQEAKHGGFMKYENGGIANPSIPKRFDYPLDPDKKSEGKVNPATAGISWNEAMAQYNAILEGLGSNLENPIIGTPKIKNALEGRYYQSEKNGNLYQVVDGKYKEIKPEKEEKEEGPKETIGLRKDYDRAYGFNAEMGDGYTVCISGNCQDGSGVMYTYWTPNADEKDPLGEMILDHEFVPAAGTDYIIGMYQGEFKDGKPHGTGEFTYNDIDAAEDSGEEFVDWGYTHTGQFTSDNNGQINLTEGVKNYGPNFIAGKFNNNKSVDNDYNLITGFTREGDVTTNFEDGNQIGDYFSIDAENYLSDKGYINPPEFKYSEGDVDSSYSAMKNYGTYVQPTEEELNARGYSSFDEFRADYERWHRSQYDPLSGKYKPYNWDNTTQWGPQHQAAWDQLMGGIDEGFVPTGSYIEPIPLTDEDNDGIPDFIQRPNQQFIGPLLEDGSTGVSTVNNSLVNKEEIEQLPWWQRSITGDRGADVAIGMGALANLAPAAYSLLHTQPKPETLPFESGVTSPIVPKRVRAQKLNHINLNMQRAKNDADFNAMNTFIDQSGGGPANLINRMATWGKKHKGDMEIAKLEKDYNTNIENQNVAIENQTELFNVRQEQEAMTQNMQLQQQEAKRLQDVQAFNTAALNKWRDDQEYMKYSGIFSAAQGIGQLTRDVLGYKGDTLKAQGYSIDNTTNRMLLRRHLGGTLYHQDGRLFCENCTNEDIANYANMYGMGQTKYF